MKRIGNDEVQLLYYSIIILKFITGLIIGYIITLLLHSILPTLITDGTLFWSVTVIIALLLVILFK